MSDNIRVSEVSEVLQRQLEGIETRIQLDEIGTILQVSDGVIRIYGLRNAEANELLELENGIKAIVMNLEEAKNFFGIAFKNSLLSWIKKGQK